MNRPPPHFLLLFSMLTLALALAGCASQPREISRKATEWANTGLQPGNEETVKMEKFAVTGGSGGQSSETARTRLPVADLWSVTQPPETGFGQYTYILLARDSGSDDDPVRRRNLALLHLVLKNNAASDLPRYLTKRDANHLLVPVKSPATVQLTGWLRTAVAVYADYEFLYADEVMRALDRSGVRGPVLFSSNLPLQPGQKLPRLFIVQDLSSCPDGVMDLWLRLFVEASNRPDFWRWDDPNGDKLFAHFVTGLELAAPILKESQEAMKSFIAFFKGESDE